MPHDLTYIELKHALAQMGCALCRLGEHYGHAYLRWLLLERVTDRTTRSTLAQSWGFCVDHAWLLQEMEWEQDKDGVGTAQCRSGCTRYGHATQRSNKNLSGGKP
jgi:hypothetical protein